MKIVKNAHKKSLKEVREAFNVSDDISDNQLISMLDDMSTHNLILLNELVDDFSSSLRKYETR